MASTFFYRRRPSGKPSAQRRAFFGPSKPESAAFFGPAPVQAKLAFGQPGDRYEQEADAVAERVVQASPPAPAVQPLCADCEKEKGVQRQAEEEEPVQAQMEEEEPVQAQAEEEEMVQSQAEEEEPVQAQAEEEEMVQSQAEEEEPVQAQAEEEEMVQGKAQGGAPAHFGSRLQARQGSGQPLPSPLRRQMERGIGADFSAVRLHTDGEAQQMSQSIHAQAFTRGRDIYFNAGKYQPGSSEGQRLLAHELTHVVQQGEGRDKPQVQREENESEKVSFDSEVEVPVEVKDKNGRKILQQGAQLELSLSLSVIPAVKTKRVKFDFGKLKLASVVSAVAENLGDANTDAQVEFGGGMSATIVQARLTSPGLFVPDGSTISIGGKLEGSVNTATGEVEVKAKPKIGLRFPISKESYLEFDIASGVEFGGGVKILW